MLLCIVDVVLVTVLEVISVVVVVAVIVGVVVGFLALKRLADDMLSRVFHK